jgi:hypothetical protein
VFSFDRMLAFEGNTGPYLLYAVVRIHNIFRKAAERGVAPSTAANERSLLLLTQPPEKTLALALLRYPAVLRATGDTLEPHRLCQYLFELAGAFSSFYDACHVIDAGSTTPAARPALCGITPRPRDGLHSLGIPTQLRADVTVPPDRPAASRPSVRRLGRLRRGRGWWSWWSSLALGFVAGREDPASPRWPSRATASAAGGWQ